MKSLTIKPTALALLFWFSGSLLAQEPPSNAAQTKRAKSDMSSFIRMTKTSQGLPNTLDTAVVSYSAGKNGVQVDLIGAVHIGDESYYAQLNQLFDQYDVLLYELVAPEGTVVTPQTGDRSINPISLLQQGMKSFLGMQSQLEKIDYTKPHMVRADMTPEQIADKMRQRGDTAWTLALSALVDTLRQQNLAENNLSSDRSSVEEMDFLELLGNPHKAKIMFASQFVTQGALDQALGSSLNQLLVVDRNAEALRGLQKQIAAGHRKIGIFYGAAHLPDLEQRLTGDFGLKLEDTRWLKAWDLTKTDQPQSNPLSLLLNLLDEIQ